MKQIAELFVFVSSPSDMAAERRIVESVIAELNPFLKDNHNVVLTPLNWEQDVVPGIGSDSQSVISSQMTGKYDIYLGLLGSRFGTETTRAGSGTEVEFDDAYNRYGGDPKSVRVLVYFKTGTDELFRIDLKQLEKVLAFREKLKKSGVLFFDFTNQDALLRLLKNNLRQLISEQFEGDHWKVLTPLPLRPLHEIVASTALGGIVSSAATVEAISEAVCENEEIQEDSSGILDAMLSAQVAMETVITSLSNLTKLSSDLTEKTTARTQGFSHALGVKGMNAVLDGVADDLDTFTKEMKNETLSLKGSLAESITSFHTAVSLFLTDRGDPSQVVSAPDALHAMASSMQEARGGIENLREILKSLPRFTVRFNKAKRSAERILADLSATITVFLDKVGVIERQIRDQLGPN